MSSTSSCDQPGYDRIGFSYTRVRHPDARVAIAIHQAFGDADSVLNVDAGTGAYEPTDRRVVAVEPSQVMIDQRAGGSALVTQASAEELPFSDESFDVVRALLSDPAAVIDLSLYWRPTGYASAVVVVDAIAWRQASVELLPLVLGEPEGHRC